MIITQKKRSRFGTGLEAIRVPGLGTLIEVDADPDDTANVAQISESDSGVVSATFINLTVTGDLAVAGSITAGSYNIVCYEDQVVCNENEVVTHASLE